MITVHFSSGAAGKNALVECSATGDVSLQFTMLIYVVHLNINIGAVIFFASAVTKILSLSTSKNLN